MEEIQDQDVYDIHKDDQIVHSIKIAGESISEDMRITEIDDTPDVFLNKIFKVVDNLSKMTQDFYSKCTSNQDSDNDNDYTSNSDELTYIENWSKCVCPTDSDICLFLKHNFVLTPLVQYLVINSNPYLFEDFKYLDQTTNDIKSSNPSLLVKEENERFYSNFGSLYKEQHELAKDIALKFKDKTNDY